jgi:hypothetical protein
MFKKIKLSILILFISLFLACGPNIESIRLAEEDFKGLEVAFLKPYPIYKFKQNYGNTFLTIIKNCESYFKNPIGLGRQLGVGFAKSKVLKQRKIAHNIFLNKIYLMDSAHRAISVNNYIKVFEDCSLEIDHWRDDGERPEELSISELNYIFKVAQVE